MAVRVNGRDFYTALGTLPTLTSVPAAEKAAPAVWRHLPSQREARLDRVRSRGPRTRSDQVLGAEHRSTLTSLNNLASLYENQGRYAAAQALRLRERPIDYFREVQRAVRPRATTAPWVPETAPRAPEAPPEKPRREIGFHVRETAPRYGTRKRR